MLKTRRCTMGFSTLRRKPLALARGGCHNMKMLLSEDTIVSLHKDLWNIKRSKSIRILKKACLFPLEFSNSKSFRHFVHVLGLRYSDGCIYHNKRNKSYTSYVCFGKKEDAENFSNDCKKFWNIDMKPYYGTNAYYVYIPSSIARLMVALGSPVGRKTAQSFRIPDFIYDLTPSLKWEFISGLFTGDGSAPKAQHGLRCSRSLVLSLNSEKSVAKKFSRGFMLDLKNILNELGIGVSNPIIRWNTPRISKNGKITYNVIIRILTEKGNMKRFLENVKYRYSLNHIRNAKNVTDILNGREEMFELVGYMNCTSQKPPKICVFLGKSEQMKLIKNAAVKLSESNTTGIYKKLAEHLYLNCPNVKSFHHLCNKYLSDWKYHGKFIPIDCVIELARLCNTEISELQKQIKQVKYIRVHNKFAIRYSDSNDIFGN